MKKISVLFVLASLWCPNLLAQGKNPVATFIREALTERSKNMVAAAEEMPADKYGFKAPPDQMTFGYLTLHIADGKLSFLFENRRRLCTEAAETQRDGSQGQLVERMKASFEFCTTALAKLDDSNVEETLVIGETKASRAMTILTLSGSWATHYSLQATYLQLNGHLPPTAKK